MVGASLRASDKLYAYGSIPAAADWFEAPVCEFLPMFPNLFASLSCLYGLLYVHGLELPAALLFPSYIIAMSSSCFFSSSIYLYSISLIPFATKSILAPWLPVTLCCNILLICGLSCLPWPGENVSLTLFILLAGWARDSYIRLVSAWFLFYL